MSVFKPASSIVRPFVKVAIDGYQGSGKSTTLAAILAGIHKDFKVNGPAFIVDNEKSAKYLVPLFTEAGIEVQVVETDAIDVLLEAMREVEKVGGVLMIDSLTKINNRMERDYLKTKNKEKIEIQDRPVLNSKWQTMFEEPFVAAQCHIGFTGRAVIDWGNSIEEDETGKKKRTFFAKGVKMAGQKESLYAPDQAIYMERRELLDDVDPNAQKRIWREATIIKDRSRVLDGKTFRFSEGEYGKTYPTLAPMFRFLLGATQPPAVPNIVAGNPVEVFGEPDTTAKEREATIEEIKDDLLLAHPGQDAASKTAKIKAVRACFDGVSAWEHVAKLSLEKLLDGRKKLREHLGLGPVPVLHVVAAGTPAETPAEQPTAIEEGAVPEELVPTATPAAAAPAAVPTPAAPTFEF